MWSIMLIYFLLNLWILFLVKYAKKWRHVHVVLWVFLDSKFYRKLLSSLYENYLIGKISSFLGEVMRVRGIYFLWIKLKGNRTEIISLSVPSMSELHFSSAESFLHQWNALFYHQIYLSEFCEYFLLISKTKDSN